MAKPGPKPKIDEIAEKQIYAALSVGASLNDAADMLMIDRTTIYRHKKKSKQFATGCMAAEKRGKIGHLNKIAKAKQWQASAWMMERKWGAEYGKKLDVTSGGKSIVIRDETEQRDRDPVTPTALGAEEGD